MATTYYQNPISLIVQYLTNIGVVAAGGLLYTYSGGTSTPLTTYTDGTGLVANPNPMTLGSSGRPQSASGSEVSFWTPAGSSVRLVVTDSGGNQLCFLDNLTNLNDPSAPGAALTQLATATTGSGADLVANAVRSYDVFASVRAANTPAPVSGQTLIIICEGASSVGDNNGGVFYWSSTSFANDDNETVIKPTAVSNSSAGRYLRLIAPQTEVIAQGNFTGTLTGLTGTVNVACSYTVEQTTFGSTTLQRCTLYVGGNSGTATFTGISNATTMTMTGLPSAIIPPTNQSMEQIPVENNSAWVATGFCQFISQVLTFGLVYPTAGGFTSSGTKGIPSFVFTYQVV